MANHYITIAAYKDWENKTQALRYSADRYGVPLQILFKGGSGTRYELKIERLYNEYVKDNVMCGDTIIFLDCRDAVFTRPLSEIEAVLESAFAGLTETQIIFQPDTAASFPLRESWFAKRVTLKYKQCANSGAYIYRMPDAKENLHGMYKRLIRLHKTFTEGYQHLRDGEEYLIPLYEIIKSAMPKQQNVCIDSDQFHVQVLQSLWDYKSVSIDTEERFFVDDYKGHSFADLSGLKVPAELYNNKTAFVFHAPVRYLRSGNGKIKTDGEWFRYVKKIIESGGRK